MQYLLQVTKEFRMVGQRERGVEVGPGVDRPEGLLVQQHELNLHPAQQGVALGRKLVSCSYCQELGQWLTWLLIGCSFLSSQSEAISAC